MKNANTKFTAISYLVICTVVGLAFIGTAFSNYDKTNLPVTDIYSVTAADLKPGMRVSGKAGYVLDVFANYGNEKKTDKQYYIISAGEGHSFYMALEEYPKNFSVLDAEIEKTYDDSVTIDNILDSSEYIIDGIVTEMNGELLDYFEEFFTDNEYFTPDELTQVYGEYVLPYYIKPVANNLTGWYFCLAVGIIFLLIGVIAYAFIIKKYNQQKKDEQYLSTLSTRNLAAKGMQDTTTVSSTITDSDKPPMGFE